MPFPYLLQERLPQGFRSANFGEVLEDMAIIHEAHEAQDFQPFGEGQLEAYHLAGGVLTVHEATQSDGAMAGYVVAERAAGRIAVHDLTIMEEHRPWGIAGFLLGRLVQARQHSQDCTELTLKDSTYFLPGQQIVTGGAEVGGHELETIRHNLRPQAAWSGITTARSAGRTYHDIYREGEHVGALVEGVRLEDTRQHIWAEGEPEREYVNVTFGAIDLLNR